MRQMTLSLFDYAGLAQLCRNRQLCTKLCVCIIEWLHDPSHLPDDVVALSLQHTRHYCLHHDDYGCLLTTIFLHPPKQNKFSVSQLVFSEMCLFLPSCNEYSKFMSKASNSSTSALMSSVCVANQFRDRNSSQTRNDGMYPQHDSHPRKGLNTGIICCSASAEHWALWDFKCLNSLMLQRQDPGSWKPLDDAT